jgi:hypothetical protein
MTAARVAPAVLVLSRTSSIVVTCVIERIVLGVRAPEGLPLATLIAVLLSTMLYVWSSSSFTAGVSPTTIALVCVNTLIVAVFQVVSRWTLTRHALLRLESRESIARYNCFLSIPTLLAAFVGTGELAEVHAAASLPPLAFLWIFTLVVANTWYSTCTFALQPLVSSPTYAVVLNASKFAYLSVEIAFFAQQLDNVTQCVACVLGFVCSTAYLLASATQRPTKKD